MYICTLRIGVKVYSWRGGEDTSPEERGGIPLSVFIILFPGEGPVKASGWIGPWNNYFYKQLIYSLY